jgi:hypothetical protein
MLAFQYVVITFDVFRAAPIDEAGLNTQNAQFFITAFVISVLINRLVLNFFPGFAYSIAGPLLQINVNYLRYLPPSPVFLMTRTPWPI